MRLKTERGRLYAYRSLHVVMNNIYIYIILDFEKAVSLFWPFHPWLLLPFAPYTSAVALLGIPFGLGKKKN